MICDKTEGAWRFTVAAFAAAAAALCFALPGFAAPDKTPNLHVAVVLDAKGKQVYEVVRGTFIPEAVLMKTPGYRPKLPSAPPPEAPRSFFHFFFGPTPEPPPAPPPAPAPTPASFTPAPVAQPAAVAPAAPAAAKIASTIGKERGGRILFNLLGAGVMLGAAIMLLRYYLSNR